MTHMSANYAVLDPTVHGQLLMNLNGFAKAANIDPGWLDRRLTDVSPASILPWVKSFRQPTKQGLLIENASQEYASMDLCSAIAAALMRNFIAPKVLTLSEYINAQRQGERVKESCLLIPNLYTMGTVQPPEWQFSVVTDGLISMTRSDTRVVLCVDDYDAFKKFAPQGLVTLLDHKFHRVLV